MSRVKLTKKVKKYIVFGVIGCLSVCSVALYKHNQDKNNEKLNETEKVTYEIGGKDSNYIIGSSIVDGCGLDQFLKGQNLQEYSSDVNGKVYVYEDSDGITYVYESNEGKINSIQQESKYKKDNWDKVLKFWKSLGNTEKIYLGYEASDMIDWKDKSIPVEYSGSSENYEYVFGRYPEDKDTIISITVTEIEGDLNE